MFTPSHGITFAAQATTQDVYLQRMHSLQAPILDVTLPGSFTRLNANKQKVKQTTFLGHRTIIETTGRTITDRLFYPPEAVKNFEATTGKSVLLSS